MAVEDRLGPAAAYWVENDLNEINAIPQIARRTFGRAADLSSLQCRLDDTGDADRDFVLKLEYIFQGAIKTVSPEMRASESVD